MNSRLRELDITLLVLAGVNVGIAIAGFRFGAPDIATWNSVGVILALSGYFFDKPFPNIRPGACRW